MKNLLKKIRFWAVWLPASVFVLLYLIVSALKSGHWRIIRPKMALIYRSLHERFATDRKAQKDYLLYRQRLKNLTGK